MIYKETDAMPKCAIPGGSELFNSDYFKDLNEAIIDICNREQFSFCVGGVTDYPENRLATWTAPENLLEDCKIISSLNFECKAINGTRDGLELISANDSWELKKIVTREFDGHGISIEFELEFIGDGEVLFRDASLSLPDITVGSEVESILELPGKNAVPGLQFTHLDDGIQDVYFGTCPAERPSLIGVHTKSDNCSLLVWSHSENFNCFPELSKSKNRVTVTHRIQCAARLSRGEKITIGKQYLRMHNGSWQSALSSFHGWYEKIGFGKLDKACPWTRNAVIYEAFIGKVSFANGISYSPYSEMAVLVADLARIKKLGFSVVQLMPRQPFSGYTVFDWHDTTIAYGGKGELKELVSRAHSLDMKVILDVIMHGVIDSESGREGLKRFSIRGEFFKYWRDNLPEINPYRKEHPEWFLEKENGEPAFMLTWLFDRANPSWQKYFIEVLKYYISEYDVDGFRFDAPFFAAQPNWRKDLPYHAGESCLGGFHLLKAAQTELRKLKPEVLWQVETSGPLFSHFADLVYDYELHWLRTSMLEPMAEAFERSWEFGKRTIQAPEMAEWLNQWRLSCPPGHTTKHVFDGHGDWWYGEQGLFQRDLFGIPAARVLFAFCAFSDGALMNFVGAEKGLEDTIVEILRLRALHKTLTAGKIEYFAPVSSNKKVLGIRRYDSSEEFRIFINFSKLEAKVEIEKDFSGNKKGVLADLLTLDDCQLIEGTGNRRLVLEPWQIRVFRQNEVLLEGMPGRSVK